MLETQIVEERLINTKAAAQHLCLSVRTLETFRQRGDGPQFIKVGRTVRYRLADIHYWLALRTVRSTAEAKVTECIDTECRALTAGRDHG